MSMSVSGCSSGSYASGAANPFKQTFQDFRGLGSALNSGDLSQAQTAFASLQSDLQTTSQNGKTSPLLDTSTQAGKDFQTLQSALQSGDTDGAKKAFAAVRQDLRAAHAHGHRHHKVDNDGDGDDAQGTSQTTSPSQSSTTPVITNSLNLTA